MQYTQPPCDPLNFDDGPSADSGAHTVKNNVDCQVTARVESLARELQELVREQALEAVRRVLGGDGEAVAPLAQAAAPARPSKTIGRRSTKKCGARRGRPAADISAITEPILILLRATPSQPAGDLARGPRMSPKQLKRPIDRVLPARSRGMGSLGRRRAALLRTPAGPSTNSFALHP